MVTNRRPGSPRPTVGGDQDIAEVERPPSGRLSGADTPPGSPSLGAGDCRPEPVLCSVLRRCVAGTGPEAGVAAGPAGSSPTARDRELGRRSVSPCLVPACRARRWRPRWRTASDVQDSRIAVPLWFSRCRQRPFLSLHAAARPRRDREPDAPAPVDATEDPGSPHGRRQRQVRFGSNLLLCTVPQDIGSMKMSLAARTSDWKIPESVCRP